METCDKLLENGLYAFTRMTRTGSFNQDLRTYYLSEQFRLDLKNGKWGNSMTIPIDGIPVTMNTDFTENEYREFRKRLLSITEISISSDYYETFYQSIPNTNLYDAYNKCLEIEKNSELIGFYQGPNIETEDTVVFNIRYRPQAHGDNLPIVKTFSVVPDGCIINGELLVRQVLDYETVVTCKKIEGKDIILSLDTDRGSFVSKVIAESSISSSKEIPIGTILPSMLIFEQFSFVTKSNEKSPGALWTAFKSKWAPCDGRPLHGSKYSKITSQPNAPDLRGLFLRGLNSFDPQYTVPPLEPNQLNPDAMPLGVFQNDEFRSHTHNLTGGAGGNQGYPRRVDGSTNSMITDSAPISATGGQETRPKNVSLFYYIRIN